MLKMGNCFMTFNAVFVTNMVNNLLLRDMLKSGVYNSFFSTPIISKSAHLPRPTDQLLLH